MAADKRSDQQQILQASFSEAEQAIKITGTVLVPPTVGAATEDKQDDQITLETAGNASLDSIDTKTVKADTDNVTVVSTVLPTGASTAALQTSGNDALTSIDGKIVAVDTGAVVVSSSALPTGASTSAKQDEEIALLTTIDTDTGTVATEVSSLNAKVTAVDTGSVTIVASALPTGASTEAKQDSQVTEAQTANTTLTSIETKLSNPLPVSGTGFSRTQEPTFTDATSIKASSGTRFLVVTLAADVKRLALFDTTGLFISWYSAAAAGTLLFITNPGADAPFDINLATGTTLYAISSNTDAGTSGSLALNYLG